MSEENDKDLENTQELFDFLQGKQPDGFKFSKSRMPRLTPDQAWAVILYLGNACWQVTDRVERCDVCGSLYHTWQEGHCLDYGRAPYHFCDSCRNGDEFAKKNARNPDKALR